MCPDSLRKAITPRTKAIIPVHMLGNPARMNEINAIGAEKKIPVLEDACEALGYDLISECMSAYHGGGWLNSLQIMGHLLSSYHMTKDAKFYDAYLYLRDTERYAEVAMPTDETYTITKGIIRSEDMDIRSTGMRLQYRGTLDFQGQVRARVEAGLLRDVWLLGPIVSTVLWPVTKLFEYKVTGTLGAPKAEPMYLVPKVVFLPFQFPFHPLRTLRGLLPEDLGYSPTTAPPLTSPKQN